MKKIMSILLAMVWMMGALAMAEEADSVKIEMPVYESEHAETLEKLLEAEDGQDALAALFLLEAEKQLENFDMEAVTGVYWLESAEAPCLLVFHEAGFWHIGLQEMVYSAYATDMEGVEDLDALMEYLREEKGRDYVEADMEAGLAQLADMGIAMEEEEK